MKRTALCASALACIAAFATDENTREVDVAKHGAWTTKAIVDTFEERQIAWSAFHPQGRNGGFALTCGEGDVVTFDAYADNMFIDALSSASARMRG